MFNSRQSFLRVDCSTTNITTRTPARRASTPSTTRCGATGKAGRLPPGTHCVQSTSHSTLSCTKMMRQTNGLEVIEVMTYHTATRRATATAKAGLRLHTEAAEQGGSCIPKQQHNTAAPTLAPVSTSASGHWRQAPAKPSVPTSKRQNVGRSGRACCTHARGTVQLSTPRSQR